MTLDQGHNDTPIGHEQPRWEVYVSDIFCIRKLLNWHISGAVRHDNTSFIPPPPSRKHFLAVGTTNNQTHWPSDRCVSSLDWRWLSWPPVDCYPLPPHPPPIPPSPSSLAPGHCPLDSRPSRSCRPCSVFLPGVSDVWPAPHMLLQILCKYK